MAADQDRSGQGSGPSPIQEPTTGVRVGSGADPPPVPHGHDHGRPSDVGGHRLAVVLGISATLLGVELIGAVISGSLALYADAGHMLTDVGGLVLALVATAFARRPATTTRTWGFRRAEVLAAAAQAAVLLAVGVVVLAEAVRRLVDPTSVAGTPMLVFGAVALVGNLVSVMVLRGSATHTLNSRAALLEVASDALGAGAVLVAAVIIAWSGWLRADSVASILIGSLIVARTWKLLHETVDILLEATPKGIDLSEVRQHLLAVNHIAEVHDLHANLVATGLPVLSAHLTIDDSCFHDGHVHQILDDVQECLIGHFDVHHSTFQFEPASHADHEQPCVEAVETASQANHDQTCVETIETARTPGL